MLSYVRSIACCVAGALILCACPREVDPPPDDAGGPVGDSGYDVVNGNSFDGPINLDDARVTGLNTGLLRAGAAPCREPVLARVYRITDGDTIWVRGDSPVIDVRIRLIGVDTPEITAPAECYGTEATTFTSQLNGRLVWLTFDSTCFDTFARLLAYVHVGIGTGDLWQKQILQRGFGTALAVGSNRTFASVFDADESAARSAGRGLWSACP